MSSGRKNSPCPQMDLLCLVNICTVKYLLINKPEYARREFKVCKRMEYSSFTGLCRFLSVTVQRATAWFGERGTVTGQNPGGDIFSCPDRQWDGIGMLIGFASCGGICGKGPKRHHPDTPAKHRGEKPSVQSKRHLSEQNMQEPRIGVYAAEVTLPSSS